ncbi:TetR/AcrR family transcriptional regulator [Anaerotardibacter muris]|uniref:TetR/AcrR family transcriptional regulator n=1 Tax=Anaerotardibacter muris TaxID=2941505 RepID=UPI00203B6F43|nr:TetR/AcrR family transcriptional regulator [Anaerotardibacter muris]
MGEAKRTSEPTGDTAQNTPGRKAASKANQRQVITDAASKLFQEQGYRKTSLSEIARQVGLDQSSLYYWFPSKEAIFEALFDANRAVPIIKRVKEEVDDRVVQLYMLIAYDVIRKCELPFDFVELESLVSEHPEKYQGLIEGYREYYQAFVDVIELGIEEGVFRECPADEQAVTILSVNEGLQHHFHANVRGELLLIPCGYKVKHHSPEAVGFMAARTIIPGMLTTPEDVRAIRDRAVAKLAEMGF